jgi:hypothetical protein
LTIQKKQVQRLQRLRLYLIALADDAEITIDIDQIGNGTATGLKITLIGTR